MIADTVSAGELSEAAGLPSSLRAGVVLLADRNFGAGLLAAQVAGTGGGLPDPRSRRARRLGASRLGPLPGRRIRRKQVLGGLARVNRIAS
jgi:hypothetical protein